MSENKKSDMTDRGFLFLAVVLGTFVLWLRYKVQIASFYLEWRYGIALLITGFLLYGVVKLRQQIQKSFAAGDLENEVLTPQNGEEAIFAGVSSKGKPVYIKQAFRRMHTQVVGTTNAGKTESVILPWAIDDIKKGRGLLMIDGKSDSSLLDKLYAYAKKHHREHDVRILSICNTDISHTFNPLDGGSALEVAERVFAAFNFENEYFKSIQYDALLHCLMILEEARIKATPYRVIECLKDERQLAELALASKNERLQSWAKDFLRLTREEREQRTSGLTAQLQCFAVGDVASIFNSENSEISLERALENGEIVYCQLPALKIPTLGKATGKMILQCLQSAVASRHLGKYHDQRFFSVYLDDFTEYLTPSFVTLLNKSRSANVGIVFAHQALGDLAGLGDGVQNTILTNSNLKVFMRTNEPESAEYFSSVIGTSLTAKITERQKQGFFGSEKTGDGSVRNAEEFKFHPNIFKQELGVGEAVVILPHGKGSLPVRLKFKKSFDLDKPEIPKLCKSLPTGISQKQSTPTNQPQPPTGSAAVQAELNKMKNRKAA
ncbi:MAG: type IV secretory system conjugative DNA transfer family protein [Bdellovibrionaceae bacterium]|nr:type IV secretory system conjugative DNA transfer family protein [Pseudobdellovibrionaceae bacterium]